MSRVGTSRLCCAPPRIFLSLRFHRLAICLSPYYLFFVIKKLFFCHSSMSCYPREHKTRDIAHPAQQER
ncbi:hypothetical protein CIT292_10245 [Citrobacter youngae ATCC 29220]|uniref:Uncharacterized protein n=1 Tax=Citrobacter youngae ATCC 29220 TaxID=500640 RepID=D4BI80_9ENTR|nr:hypothetical protein CIT292_10245 [Citrobacter youngae ATCC 29220]